MAVMESVRWSPDGTGVRIIDQTQLPARFVERDLRTLDDVCTAIATLAVRGAPAIGIAGAMGLVASLRDFATDSPEEFLSRVDAYAARIRATRPTAVNLPRALDRMLVVARASQGDAHDVLDALRDEATSMLELDRAMCRRIGEQALPLIENGAHVLTHCNAGALATAGIGTALAPIYLAHQAGRDVHVYVDETRPLLQGSRLTAWELSRAGIPVTVIVDGAAASLMRAGDISLCIVGADRIAANGDVANKIGTYAVALAAQHHGIPFYVAAPTSTLDPSLRNGDQIPIERRAGDEIVSMSDAKALVTADNPAFDITPGEMITSIVTDQGVFERPYAFEHAWPLRESVVSHGGEAERGMASPAGRQ
jgi:methylthioribose-1-phosphate isomerase